MKHTVWKTVYRAGGALLLLSLLALTLLSCHRDPCADSVHAYGEATVIKEPTFEEEGMKQSTCLECGDVKEEAILKIPVAYTISVEGVGDVYVAADGRYSLEIPGKDGYKFMGYVTEDGQAFALSGVVDQNVSVKPVFDRLTTDGLRFSTDERVYMPDLLPHFPATFGVDLKMPEEGVLTGVLFSNSQRWDSHISYQINKKGQPCVEIGNLEFVGEGPRRKYAPKTYKFNEITLEAGSRVELFFVIDVKNAAMHCYVDGELRQTISDVEYLKDECFSKNIFVLGGNILGSNYAHFRGEIYSVSVWSDIRTAAEIAQGTGAPADDALMAHYSFLGCAESERLLDLSGSGQDLLVDRLWLDESEVEPATGDYSFAIIGDTQSLMATAPEKMSEMYDWILANRDKYNIKYAMSVGDITEDGTAEEFEFAKENFYKFKGKIPFSVLMGNHDKFDENKQIYVPDDYREYPFNQSFYDEDCLAQLDGWYAEGDLSCSYNAFEVGDVKWLLVNLEFGPTDAMLEWASDVIAAHPDRRVIVITHAYLYRDGTTIDFDDCYPASRYNPDFNDGDEIFDKLISRHENIEIVIGGHDPYDHVVYSQVEGKNGNTVTELLIDPQYMDALYGATGMVTLLHFSEADNTMTVRHYSTAKGMYGSERSQFTVKLDLN